jgi:hypothetical protein
MNEEEKSTVPVWWNGIGIDADGAIGLQHENPDRGSR